LFTSPSRSAVETPIHQRYFLANARLSKETRIIVDVLAPAIDVL
jgi:hypothetical protein